MNETVQGQTLLEIAKQRGVSYEALCHMKDRRGIQQVGRRGRAALYDPSEFREKETIEGDKEKADYRRRFEKARTEKLEIANAKARGELIDRAYIARVFSELYNIDRAILLNVGPAHAGTIAALDGEAADRTLKIQKIIDDEIYAALGAIKAELNKFLRRIEAGEIQDGVPETKPAKQKVKPKTGAKRGKKPTG